jgi:hypothetical protein
MEGHEMTTMKRAAAAALLAAGCALPSAPSLGSAFVAWKVADVSADDVLMVRAYPNATSRILVGYPEGVMLSMTGRCTGNIHLEQIQGQPAWKQRQLVRSEWCELWLDPYGTGEFRNGWVYGRYIRPA